LGALDAARQKTSPLPAGSSRRLVIASDFLEDDRAEHFVTDRALANPAGARELALLRLSMTCPQHIQ
jgi:hypothetical protein